MGGRKWTLAVMITGLAASHYLSTTCPDYARRVRPYEVSHAGAAAEAPLLAAEGNGPGLVRPGISLLVGSAKRLFFGVRLRAGIACQSFLHTSCALLHVRDAQNTRMRGLAVEFAKAVHLFSDEKKTLVPKNGPLGYLGGRAGCNLAGRCTSRQGKANQVIAKNQN